MKKTILICLMGSLCLSINPPSAQSKVAESPGADLLHRFAGPTVSPHSGDTHRGGAILSDTFLKSTAHEIDGGPCSVDGGPNYETDASARFLSAAPRSDVSDCPPGRSLRSPDNRTTRQPDNLTPVLSPVEATSPYLNCKQQTAVDCGQWTVDHQHKGFSLVDDSTSQGQEDSIPSARREGVLLYGEIIPLKVQEQLTLEVWENPIDPITHNPAMEYSKIPLQSGTLKTGNPGAYWFNRSIPLDFPAYFSLQVGEVQLIRELLLFPRDSVMFQWDERSSQLAFAGPSKEWLSLQQALSIGSQSESLENPIVIHSLNPSAMFGDAGEMQRFADSQKSGFSRQVSVWKVDPAEMLRQLKDALATEKYQPQAALELIESYSGKIPDSRLELLAAEQTSKAWKHYWVLLQSLRRYAEKDKEVEQELRSFFETSLLDFNPAEQFPGRIHSPAYLEMNYEKVRLMQALFHKDPLVIITELFQGVEKERMLAKHLFRTFPASHLGFHGAMDLISDFQDLNLKSSVADFLAPFAPNTRIDQSTFISQTGDTIGLDQFEGKTVLVHFWFTGCKASSAFYSTVLKEMSETITGQKDVQIVSVSVDSNPKVWTYGLSTGKYSDSAWLQLNVGEIGSFHPFLKTYGIYTYPHVMLIDKKGKLVQSGGFERNVADLISAIEAVR